MVTVDERRTAPVPPHKGRAILTAAIALPLVLSGCAAQTRTTDACLDKVRGFAAQSSNADAVVVQAGAKTVLSWGMVDANINTHSGRKSVIGLLYGIAAEKGLIDLDATLEQLGVGDSKAGLTKGETQARIRDLLNSASGVYLPAQGETETMKRLRPAREAHKPGTFFYYNNWDFNALGTIFEKVTKIKIGVAIDEWLGKPLGFQDFKPENVFYRPAEGSEHDQYIIFMSARDLARIGAMMLDGGRWNGVQVVPERWVAETARPTLPVTVNPWEPTDHYSNLWWVDADTGVYWASGWGGQFLTVDPRNGVAVVSRTNTGMSSFGRWWYGTFKSSGRKDDHWAMHQQAVACLKPAGG